jgi:ParB family chromosome partitioning protein
VKQFGFKHSEVAEKVGKSREYVSNSIRLLALPEEMQQALSDGKINEGHTRPLLMLGR